MKKVQEFPETATCFGLLIDQNQVPPRIILVHNNADPLKPNGEEGKSDGYGLPGGGKETKDQTLFHAIRREFRSETGIWVKLAPTKRKSEFGEVLREFKPWVNNIVYTFHVEPTTLEEIVKEEEEPDEFILEVMKNNKLTKKYLGMERIIETMESERSMSLTLGSILLMPLAVKKEYMTDGPFRALSKNREGIFFSHRIRIIKALDIIGYDFLELVPNLFEIIEKLDPEDFGEGCYEFLSDIASLKIMSSSDSARRQLLNMARPDEEELIEKYQDWATGTPR